MKENLLRAVFAAGLAFGIVGCGKPASEPPAASDESTVSSLSETPSTPRPEFERLKGRWERPDGGYIIEIRSVDAEGKLDAGYFNPSPINVSRARAYHEGGETKVFIELQDVNYPGCTYQLAYDAKNDQFFGLYHQAGIRQTYDVAFGRLK